MCTYLTERAGWGGSFTRMAASLGCRGFMRKNRVLVVAPLGNPRKAFKTVFVVSFAGRTLPVSRIAMAEQRLLLVDEGLTAMADGSSRRRFMVPTLLQHRDVS